MKLQRPSRPGVASVWLLAILAFLAAVTALIGNEVVQSRSLSRRRASELQAEWLARGGLELGMRASGDAAGSIPLPADLATASSGTVSWKPTDNGQMVFLAEATAGEKPDRITRRISVVAKRQGTAWIIAQPIELSGGRGK